MSGGFFRGTSADQDTRFSNKQAKLMKSQKFATELDHLVDMTKVKMDVMRPWIANRVTELLGFEDEVLINFIYGLLDGKKVNGKEVQISLTGFMEKNTGKFMKELWMLLLSAQKNASGVPQQFLDAKEEETRKKKAETDRIASEIQKKKEKEKESREIEQEKTRKMDDEADILRAKNSDLEPNSKHEPRASSGHSADERETGERNGSRARSRVSKSPHSADHSSSSPPNTRSRSISKSLSNSRNYSDKRHKSRSVSVSPLPRGRSISSERVYHSPPRRSITPRRKYSPRRSLSPPRRRTSHSRRRSTSRTRIRSPSPIRRRLRSPTRRRSRSPIRHRSQSPVRRRSRSPVRYRSRSPMRRRSPSPLHSRSPSPLRRRSPSPLRRRSPSPVRRRSPSPVRRRFRRSPSFPRHRSPSPFRRRSPIPSRRRFPSPSRHRSPSPDYWSSPSPVRRLSPSPGRRRSPKRQRRSPVQSPKERFRTFDKFSPIRRAGTRENAENSSEIHKGPDSVVRRPPISLRSPQRDPRDRDDTRKKAPSSSPSPYRSQSHLGSPLGRRRRSPSEDRRSYSPYVHPVKPTNEVKIRNISVSPPRRLGDQKPRHDSPETSVEKGHTNHVRGNGDQKLESSEKKFTYSSTADERKGSLEKAHYKAKYSPERVSGHRSNEIGSRPDGLELRKKDQEIRSEKASRRALHPEVSDQQQLPQISKDSSLRHRVTYPEEVRKTDVKNEPRSNEIKGSKQLHETKTALKSIRKVDEKERSGSLSSGSQESDKHHREVHERRKHKRSEKKEVASDDSDDSEIEDRKEAKRRRKEEKRLRKEERRRRREERRRRREARRAEKLKAKSIETVTPLSDSGKNRDGNASDGDQIVRMEYGASDPEVTESEQKRLEIELRKKALESLRAKKGVGH